MTPAEALRELLEVSEDVVAAAIFARDGAISAATGDDARARAVVDAAGAMLVYADALRRDASTARLEALTTEGGVFVLRDGDRAVVGVTGPDPAPAVVHHDLRECLHRSRVAAGEAVGAGT